MNEILGIDTSEHQRWREGQPDHFGIDRPDFDKITNVGPLGFHFQRLSRGAAYRDPSAPEYLDWGRQAGAVIGGYHFLEAEDDGTTQAENFAGAIEALGDLELDAFILDIEDAGQRFREAMEFIARFRQIAFPGTSLGLYTRQSYLDAKGDPEFQAIARYFEYLWLADYRSDDGKAARFLSGDRWRTPPEDESIRPGPLWQWGPLRFTDPDDKRPGGKRAFDRIDGNVFVGTQATLLGYLHAR